MYQNYKAKGAAMAEVPAVVTVEWLKENIDSDNTLAIVDASYSVGTTDRDAFADFKAQHIPGAVYFDIDECADTSSKFTVPHMLPSPALFEEYVGTRGISNASHVVVYDNNPQFPVFSSQRVWWTFRVFGHEKVSVLEGGLSKWVASGGQVTNEETVAKKQRYKANFHRDLVKSYEDIEANIKSQQFNVVDARPPGRYNGTAPEPLPGVKPGHVPNTSNAPFMKLMNLDNKTYKTPEELKTFFKEHGVDLSGKITFMCGSALQATNLALAAFLCGKKDVSIYDGSWTEWYRRAPASLTENVPDDA